jgi:hypothetical protein
LFPTTTTLFPVTIGEEAMKSPPMPPLRMGYRQRTAPVAVSMA